MSFYESDNSNLSNVYGAYDYECSCLDSCQSSYDNGYGYEEDPWIKKSNIIYIIYY